MAGIDLLSKYLDGTDEVGGAGKRFSNFVERYFYLTPSDSEILYQLRNSLLHSFGLVSISKQGKYRFQLDALGNGTLLNQNASGLIKVDLLDLHHRFEASVTAYHAELQASHPLQMHFDRMFPTYGKVLIT